MIPIQFKPSTYIMATMALVILGLSVWVGVLKNDIRNKEDAALVAETNNKAYLSAYESEWKRIHKHELERLTKEKASVKTEADAVRDDRASGNIGLRPKFHCPAVPSTPGTGIGGIEPEPILSPEDEEFLIRGAEETDTLRAERNSVIRRYNDVRESIIEYNRQK